MIRPWVYWTLFLELVVIARHCDGWRRERPALLVHDGNLLLRSARDRNISLDTIGISTVNLNGVDLKSIALSAHNAAQLVDRWNTGILADVEGNMRRLMDIIEGPSGLQSRLIALELGDGNSTSSRQPDQTGPLRVSAVDVVARTKLQRLSNRIQRLEAKLRTVVSQLNTDECASNPCQNGGKCEDMIDSFKCICPDGWEGSTCNIDVNECVQFIGTDLGCQHGGTCLNVLGSYRCICPRDWYGVHCSARSSSCESQTSNELCDHGMCVTDTTYTIGYRCICDQGWDHDGSTPACSKDIDECSNYHPKCSTSPPVPCINVPGSYHCGACPSGYTGNGYYCDDIDECVINNGGCSTSPHVQCINTRGSRVCSSCPAGYQGDGIICTYAGFCGINNGGCHPKATCYENPSASSSSVLCRCPLGYEGNGMGPHGCQPAGRNEITLTPCSSNPCIHGMCTPNGLHDYTCICMRGFSGRTCTTSVNPCDSNPCLNGGTCTVSLLKRAVCDCPVGFTGTYCNVRRESCGGVYHESSGTLKFPNLADTYQHSLSCAWILSTNHSSVLNITFTAFDLEKSRLCHSDFLQVHDGRTAGDQQIGRYCGDDLPNGGTIVSTHNSLYLWFHSDASIAHGGFTLQWTSIVPVCGGEIRNDHGTLSSPGSPGKYPVNRDCLWYIHVKSGKRIQFHFFTMMLEEHPTCDFDYVKIKEGPEADAKVFGVYCNHTHPPPLLVSGSSAVVHFHSDNTGQDQGFQISFSAVEGYPGCGGVFTRPSGEVTSPNHPTTYDTNLDCEWTLQQPLGERIQLTWMKFDVESTHRCWADYIEVYDGPNSDSPLIGRYCGRDMPPNSLSSSNIMLIVFKTDWSRSGEGFRVKYDVWCGGEYTQETNVIHSPYYPETYPASRTCIYQIQLPEGKAISLSIQDMEIEETHYSSCGFDFLEIRDGDNENSTLLGKYCGGRSQIPEDPLLSTHNYMYLKFHTDGSRQGRGFYANYTTVDRGCGGLLKKPLGLISYPNEGSRYLNNMDCTWLLQAPPGYIVKLTWLSFSLERTASCRQDYVRIHENFTSIDALELGQFCGTDLPPIMTTQSSMMTIRFHSDWSITHEGFQASYLFIDASKHCGGHYRSPTGSLTSPNYPEPYPSNKECEWVIRAANRHQVTLSVREFQIEEHSDCEFDWLEIRNGGSTTSPLIGKYCGTTIPREITSFGNEIHIKFVSDFSRHGHGFKIDWDSSAIGCGGTLTTDRGSISSPNYPQKYDHNAECNWNVRVAAGNLVEFIIMDLNLEMGGSDCWHDFIEFHEGLNLRGKRIGKYCGTNHPTQVKALRNEASVRFRSDWSANSNGFLINYKTLCQGIQVSGQHRGVIESPNFPYAYAHDSNCSWSIRAPLGNKLNITFSYFDLESGYEDNCAYDYVEIQEGDGSPTRNLGKFCGSKILPAKIVSTEREVFIHFHSDTLFANTGFRLEWIVNGCGGHLTKPSGFFTSPNYADGYSENIECEWLIEVEYMNSIEITFLNVDLETVQGCPHDYVVGYGGVDETAPELFHLCRTSNITTYTSGGNKMFIKFHSDSSITSKGFQAKYSSIDLQCGGKFTTPTGNIHSPNYPNSYPPRQSCEWLIQVPNTHLVNLTFLDFTVEDTTNCTDDYVRIYDGPTRDAQILGSHCGRVLPPSYLTTTNEVLVVMRTDAFVPAKGFKATYNIACGARIITNDQGVITMNSATGLHTDTNNCTWTIIAENPADHVTLTLTDVSLDSVYFYGDPCMTNYIQVLDGEELDGPQKIKVCDDTATRSITSEGNALTVNAITTYMPGYTARFTGIYSVISSACGAEYNGLRGAFASPGYPQNYPENAECVWVIRTSPGNPLKLEFESFELVQSDNCNLQYVEIRVNNGAGELLDVFCGTNSTAVTSNSDIWVKFNSMGGTTAKGFLARFSVIYDVDLGGPSGQIASPAYPTPLFREATYSWRITTNFSSAIRITFEDFRIDRFLDYCIETLEIYDGYDSNAPVLLNACGMSLPNPIQSSSNVIYIKLSPSSNGGGTWFLLSWIQIPRSSSSSMESSSITKLGDCNEIISMTGPENTSYIFNSPGWPGGYARNLDCTWTFESEPGTHLSMKFIKMNIEESSKCIMDQVTVYSGNPLTTATEWTNIGTYCLSNATYDTITATNQLKVNFRSDVYMNGTGFKAAVTKVCGGQLDGPNGVIDVHNGTDAHRLHSWILECKWKIVVRPGRNITVKFEEMGIHSSDDTTCTDYYLMLKNGGEETSPLLGAGKYCGHTVPASLTTSSNQLFIKIHSPREATRFRITYSEVGVQCGGNILLTKQQRDWDITNPNFPNIPSPHTECFWTVMAPGGEEISIHFAGRFDLIRSADCSVEYLEIRDGGTESSNLLGRYCNTIPSTISTIGNVMYIHFYTDNNYPSGIFEAKLTISTCGGIYRGSSGVIKSPNYPQMYPPNINCTWWIVGPLDHTLKIQFREIHLPNLRQCSRTDFVSVSNAPVLNMTGDEIGKYCGRTLPDPIETSSNVAKVTFTSDDKEYINYKGFSLNFTSSLETCGGEFHVLAGEFTSPGYPNGRARKRYCGWRITVPAGLYVKLEILDLDLRGGPSSERREKIMFFNDFTHGSLIKTIKASDPQTTISSTGNLMLVAYWSVGGNHRGFKAKFTGMAPPVCEGSTSGIRGSLLPAQTNLFNLSTYYCNWKFTSPFVDVTDQTLALSISASFSNWAGRRASLYPYTTQILVHDHRWTISKITNSTGVDKTIIRCPSPINHVVATRFSNAANMTFAINYSWQRCGGVLTGPWHNVTSSAIPANATNPVNCAWQVDFPDNGETIRLSFKKFNLVGPCSTSYFILRNGGPQAPHHKICESNKEDVFITQSNNLWIEYYTENSSSIFEFTLEENSGGCGGVLHGSTGLISSPRYPQRYPDNTECTWDINVEDGYHIGLSFFERFNLEFAPNCSNDYIQVSELKKMEFGRQEWIAMPKVCGRDVPQPFNTTSNRMRVVFHSNNNIQGDGFRARWNVNCGGVLQATKQIQYLRSPGYPRAYEGNLFCSYHIMAPGKNIIAKFSDFELETGDDDCRFDNVTITSPEMTGKSPIWCGTNIPPAQNARSELVINFKTDKHIQRRGFQLNYSLDECGGDITEPSTIASPLSNGRYLGRLNCTWTIRAPKGKSIVLRFERLDLEMSMRCSFDYIAVYEGPILDKARRLAMICGTLQDDLPVIPTANNTMTINFATDMTSHHGGFEAKVSFSNSVASGCGGQIELSGTQQFRTQNSEKYDALQDCHWKITAPENNAIRLIISSMDLKNATSREDQNSSKECSGDYLEIRDGPSPMSELIGKYCGNTAPTVIISSLNTMWIRFVSDGTTNGRGVTGTLESLPSYCGNSTLIVGNLSRTLASPSFPNHYAAGIRCRWNLVHEQGFNWRKFQIRFKTFDLTNSEQCSGDKLVIEDKSNRNYISEGFGTDFVLSGTRSRPRVSLMFPRRPTASHTYCGNALPHDYYSNGDQVVITFTSSLRTNESHAGFELEYNIASCSRNYTAPQGRIVHEAVTDCWLTITAAPNHTISLYFSAFTLFSPPGCSRKALQVFDGSFNTTPIATLCGLSMPSPVFSTGNLLSLHAWSNRGVLFESYDITYTTTDQGRGCGGELYNYGGRFSSPLFPQPYRSESNCIWDVSVPSGLIVVLKFIEFDIGSRATCETDYLTVFDAQADGEILKSSVYCGGDNPADFHSSGEKVRVQYKTSVNNGGRGWIIRFSAEHANMARDSLPSDIFFI